MVALFTPPVLQAVDVNGEPYSGAKLYFYQTGTTTLITVYQNSALTTPHTNPVVADASGQFAPIYVSSTEFKIVLTTSADVTIRTVDPVLMNMTDAASQLTDLGIPQTASTFLQRNAGNTAFEAKTVEQVRTAINPAEYHIVDYGGAAANTKAQNKTALQSAIAACNTGGGGTVVVPPYIDYGLKIADRSTYPDFSAVTAIGMKIWDESFSTESYPSPAKQGWHTRIWMNTPQTSPSGQHDGNGFRVLGDWHPYLWVDTNPEVIALGSRPSTYNYRTSLYFSLRGKAIYQMQMGNKSGDFSDNELLGMNWLAYNTDGTVRYSLMSFSYDQGLMAYGVATTLPSSNHHFRMQNPSYSTGMFESTTTSCRVFLRNSNGSAQDIEIQNDSRSFKITYTGVGDAFTIDTARNGQFNANLNVVGALSKGSGTFDIAHPDPAKAETHRLRHSFVESPTRGDNIYRFTVTVDGEATIDLPDYWPHLNENPQVWVNALEGFGRGYGKVDVDGKKLAVFADMPGTYNVLLIGTRCDEVAKTNFDPLGVEYEVATEA